MALASGGYADNSTAAGSGSTLTWSPTTTIQYSISIAVSSRAAGSVDVKSGAAYVASGKSTRTVTAGTATGTAVETTPEFSAERILWLGN